MGSALCGESEETNMRLAADMFSTAQKRYYDGIKQHPAMDIATFNSILKSIPGVTGATLSDAVDKYNDQPLYDAAYLLLDSIKVDGQMPTSEGYRQLYTRLERYASDFVAQSVYMDSCTHRLANDSLTYCKCCCKRDMTLVRPYFLDYDFQECFAEGWCVASVVGTFIPPYCIIVHLMLALSPCMPACMIGGQLNMCYYCSHISMLSRRTREESWDLAIRYEATRLALLKQYPTLLLHGIVATPIRIPGITSTSVPGGGDPSAGTPDAPLKLLQHHFEQPFARYIGHGRGALVKPADGSESKEASPGTDSSPSSAASSAAAAAAGPQGQPASPALSGGLASASVMELEMAAFQAQKQAAEQHR